MNPPIDFAIFMKVGVHGAEPLESIVVRKLREESDCGYFLWGYGGSLCHPTTQVIPLVRSALEVGAQVVLSMLSTPSRHLNRGGTASFASENNLEWRRLAPGLRVTASRYAFVCASLEKDEATLDLAQYEVAVGPSTGRPVTQYLRGRVDKAAARRSERASSAPTLVRPILRAQLVEPYAVYLR